MFLNVYALNNYPFYTVSSNQYLIIVQKIDILVSNALSNIQCCPIYCSSKG